MTDPTAITPEKRTEIKAKLAEFDTRIAAIEEEARSLRAQLDPIIMRSASVEEERELYLEERAVEVAGECETCGALLFVGERGSRPYTDETQMVFCVEHSMTYGDIKHHWEIEDPPVADEDIDLTEARDRTLKFVAAHIADGGSLDDKCTEVFR